MRLALGVALLAAVAQALSCELPGGDAKRIESVNFSLAYRTQPAKLAVGEHFSVEYAVCPKGGAALPRLVGVNASMPEHRHGMNYKPGVTALGGGRYRAEGLLFHMPGR